MPSLASDKHLHAWAAGLAEFPPESSQWLFSLNHRDSHNLSAEVISVLPGHLVANISPENIHGFVLLPPPRATDSPLGLQSHRESGQSPGGQGRVFTMPCNLCLGYLSAKRLPNVGHTVHSVPSYPDLFLPHTLPSLLCRAHSLSLCSPQHQGHFGRKTSLTPPGKDGPFLDTLRVQALWHLKQQ